MEKVAGSNKDADRELLNVCRLLLFTFPFITFLFYPLTIRQAEGSDCPIVLDLNRNGRIDITGHVAAQEKGLCCTNRVRDSSRESSVVAVVHEQTHTPRLQDPELARL